jgi:NAD(P)-dependent dehydrogenase (short-subunit alcohol dehydrogenase family)
VLSCRAAVANFRKGGKGGHIVNISARPALNPRQGAGMTAYTASKAAVAAFTVALAEELKGENISVIALAPRPSTRRPTAPTCPRPTMRAG